MCQERVRANLMFALERITHSFLCTMGEHKVRPYIGLVNKKMRNLLFKHSKLFVYDTAQIYLNCLYCKFWLGCHKFCSL